MGGDAHLRLVPRDGVVQWRPALRVGHVDVFPDSEEVLHGLEVAQPAGRAHSA